MERRGVERQHKDLKILFLGKMSSTFVKQDLNLLKQHFQVKTLWEEGKDFFSYLKIFLKLILKIFWADVVFIWFAASIQAFLAIFISDILGRKSVVVSGGFDTVCLPEINYGVFCSAIPGFRTKIVFKRVNLILIVSPSLESQIIENTGICKLQKKIMYLPLGFNVQKWGLGEEKDDVILTVNKADRWKRLLVKGIDRVLNVAKIMPKKNFIIVGVYKKIFKKLDPPPNVKFISFLPQEKLLSFYQRAKVYLQLSRHEGMANTICEAMLCGCIPILTKVGHNPWLVGDLGFLVSPNLKEVQNAIENALQMPEETAHTIGRRIKEKYPLERREQKLTEILNRLVRG